MKMHVITPLFNPGNYESVVVNMRRFLVAMGAAGLQVTMIEAAFGDQPYSDITVDLAHVDHVKVRAKSTLWLKENLGNVAASRIPHDADAILWFDGDVEFLRADWVDALDQALQHHAVVQPWSECLRTGPTGQFLGHDVSFASQYCTGKKWPGHPVAYGQFWHPGYAWCFRREAFENVGGLLDIAICGAADHHMATALIGLAQNSVPAGMSDSYRKHVLDWQALAEAHIKRDLGFVSGSIRHHWHGRAADRRYQERWQILESSHYDPDVDLRRNIFGVYELSGNNIMLRDGLRKYFRARNDDANTL